MAVIAGFIANEEGRAALPVAVREAQRRESDLIVVVHAPSGEPEATQTALAEAAQLTHTVGINVELRELSGQDLADEILALATEIDPELIVIGLRRRSITGKLILGSNAQRILLDSKAPVLAVKSIR